MSSERKQEKNALSGFNGRQIVSIVNFISFKVFVI